MQADFIFEAEAHMQSKSGVVLLEQGHFHKIAQAKQILTKSKLLSKRQWVYESLVFKNAILRESSGGVDRTEYCSAVHTKV